MVRLLKTAAALAAIFFTSVAFAAKAPPPTLSVSAINPDSVSLYWTDVSGNELKWTLQRSTLPTGPFTTIAQLNPNTTNYTDTTVVPAKTYYYRVGYSITKRTRKNSNILKVKTPAGRDTVAPSVAITGPASNSVVAGTITLSATASDNVGVLRVDFLIDGLVVGSSTNAPYSISFNSASVASGPHTLSATARDMAGNIGTSSSVPFTIDNTAPSVPTSLAAQALSSTQIRLTWVASTDTGSGVAFYRVYRSGVLIGTLTPPPGFIDLDRLPNTQYCYTVTAIDGRGNESAHSASACATTTSATDTTPPTVPTGVVANAPSCSQVTISWSASTDTGSGMQSYLVYKNGNFWREVPAPTTVANDFGVVATGTYSYSVVAKDNLGNLSASSSTSSVTLPACADTNAPTVPTGVSATAASCSQVNISWNASTDSGSGVQKYMIYRNGVFWREVNAPATTTTDTTVTSSNTYTYAVAARDVAGNQSANSAAAGVNVPACADSTAPTVPAGVVATAASCSQVNISWNASTDAGSGVQSYLVYRNGSLWREVASPALSTTDTTVTASNTYTYAVAAKDAAGNQSAGSTSATANVPACPDTTAPSVPLGVAASVVSCSQVNVSWNASTDTGSGVQKYMVYRNGTFWREVNAPATSTFDTTVTASNTYTYAVAARDVAGNQSANSSSANANVPACPDTTAPSVPTGVAASVVSCSQVNVSWSASTDTGSGVQKYMVYRNGSFWREVNAPATSTIDTTVTSSNTYTYAVAARDVAGNQSATSSSATANVPACPDTIAPNVPVGLAIAAVNCSQVNLSWYASTDSGSGIQKYMVYRNGTFWREVDAPTTNTVDTTVAASTSYTYAVAARDVAGNQSANSSNATVNVPACPDTTAPSVPTSVAAAATSCSQVSVTWNASTDAGSGVQKYWVYRNGLFWREVNAPATSTIDATVAASSSYSYAVAARDAAGNQSATSTAANANVPACPDTTAPSVPANVVATAVSCSRIDVTWSASTDTGSGVRAYRIHRDGAFVQEVLAPAVSWSDTGMTGVVTCAYAVSAVDNAGNGSSTSSSSTATTPSCGPANGRFVAVTLLGSTDSDYGMAVDVDSRGNFLLAGTVAGRPHFAKLSPTRQILWEIELGNAGNVHRILFAPNGDVVLTGYFYGTVDFGGGPMVSAGGYDIFVAKYSADGQYRWAHRFGSAQGADFAGDEAGHGLAIDSQGNIAVAGSFLDTVNFGTGPITTAGAKDAFILKMNPDGQTLWVKSFGSTGTDDAATSADFDSNDNLFIGGRFSQQINLGGTPLTSAGSYDICIAKYSPSGTPLWSKRAGGSGYENIGNLSVDVAGDVVVSGNYRLTATFDGVPFTSVGEEDVYLVKYSGANGAQQWAKSFGSWNTDLGYSVATDSDRNIVIAGRLGAAMNFGGGNVSTPRNGFNIYAAKFTPAGTHVWSKALGTGREDARGVAIDSRNFSFITGRCALTNNFGGGVFSNIGSNLNPDMFVLELEP